MDYDIVAAIGLVTGDVGVLRGAFRGVVADRLVYSVVSMLRVLFLRLDLDLEIVLESMFEGVFGTVTRGVLGSASKVDAVCELATLGDLK